MIAGLITKPITPQDSTESKNIACIGDELRVDDRGVTLLPVRNPVLAIATTFKIANCQLNISNRDKLELKLIKSLSKDLVDDSENDSKKAQIISRVLKIGFLFYYYYYYF
jgi:hypothetical protein